MSKSNLPKQPSRSGVHSGLRIHPSITFTVTILVLLYLGLNAWIYFYGTKIFNFNLAFKNAATSVSVVKKQQFGLIPTPTARPIPGPRQYYPLPPGKQEWGFSYGPAAIGPKPQDATVDPLTPNKGDTQTVSLDIKYTAPVTAVSATEYTDNGPNVHPLLLASGTSEDGTWSGNWAMPDTYAHTYHINFLVVSKTGNWSGALMFR